MIAGSTVWERAETYLRATMVNDDSHVLVAELLDKLKRLGVDRKDLAIRGPQPMSRDDLIERLRQTDGTTDVSVIFRRLREAADEIEKLRRKLGDEHLEIEQLRDPRPGA
jgi:hypothetical protein